MPPFLNLSVRLESSIVDLTNLGETFRGMQLNHPPPSTPLQQSPFPHSKGHSFPEMLSKRPWSQLFRSPFEPSKTAPTSRPSPSPVSQAQTDSQAESNIATFMFCQNKLLASIEDTKKLAQDVREQHDEDKVKFEELITSTRTLIDTVRDDNITLHAGVLTDGSFSQI